MHLEHSFDGCTFTRPRAGKKRGQETTTQRLRTDTGPNKTVPPTGKRGGSLLWDNAWRNLLPRQKELKTATRCFKRASVAMAVQEEEAERTKKNKKMHQNQNKKKEKETGT